MSRERKGLTESGTSWDCDTCHTCEQAMDGEMFIGLTMEEAQHWCETEDVLWYGYYITSVRAIRRWTKTEKIPDSGDDKITEVVHRG